MVIFNLYKSDKPTKKFMIKYINPDTEREKTIYFGAANMSDYTIHKSDERKNMYIRRHSGMGEDWDDPTTAGFYAKNLLWNKKTLAESIKDTNKKYNIKIVKKR